MIIQTEERYPLVTTPETVYQILLTALKREDAIDQTKEHFWVLLLNTRHRLIKFDLVCVGGLVSAVIHPREVFVRAILCSAASIIIAHNHPSNDPTPTPEDIALTRELQQAGRILRIEVTDHVIVAETEYVSLKRDNLM